MAEVKQTVSFEGATLGFKNFAGKEGQYNREGDRNFVVFLTDHEQAQALFDQGWNVKFPKEREGLTEDQEAERNPYLAVDASFGAIPPKIIMYREGHPDEPTRLTEEEVDMLDWVRITNADLIIRPYNWSVSGNSGVKAYLKALYVTIETDEFQEKYGI